jgi:hypothetical protein
MKNAAAVVMIAGMMGATIVTSSGCISPVPGETPGGGDTNFSCEVENVFCYEWDNIPSSDVMAEETVCAEQKGTPVSACSSANRIGTCQSISATDGVSIKVTYYSGGNVTASQGQMACAQDDGTWTGG